MDNKLTYKRPIRQGRELTHMLIDFTVKCLFEKPAPIVPYAKNYFDKLYVEYLERERELEIIDTEEACIVHDLPDYPEDFMSRGRGKVIYSEPYNPELDDEDGEIAHHPKSVAQKEKLLQVISKCLLFRALDEEQIHKVINAMFERVVETGESVIKQGDDGDNFYIIDRGLFSVYIDNKFINMYKNEGSFGELALMYNMPRAATVKAITEGALWAMDRQTFRKIVVKAAFKKRKKYEEFLHKVPMLQELDPYEMVNVADALIPKTYRKDTTIIRQGDNADGMYFIEKGRVEVYIENTMNGEEKKIKDIEEGGYFGELALVTKKPRAATIRATDEVKCAFLDVDTFERLLGPCMDVMHRNIETYEDQVHKIFGSTSNSNVSMT